MKDDGEGFLQRWSRRKAGVAPGAEDAPVVPAPAATPAPPAAETPPLPTLADVAALTRHSDYARFMLPGVDGAVRNAALKKLFSDPHFNVMDGLDTYIDDYGKPDPLPLSMLRRMNQSAALGLFESDVAADAPPAAPAPEGKACPDGAAPGAVAESIPAEPPPARARAENDPDLRLQPDDADRRPGAGPGARS